MLADGGPVKIEQFGNFADTHLPAGKGFHYTKPDGMGDPLQNGRFFFLQFFFRFQLPTPITWQYYHMLGKGQALGSLPFSILDFAPPSEIHL
jgi:hypothetical protein